MDAVTSRATKGAAMVALSRKQKIAIASYAKQAFELQVKCDLVQYEVGKRSAAFTQWRREQQLEACGKSSLRACTNEDYQLLKAHFLNLAGRKREAFKLYVRQQNEPREWMLAKLGAECKKARRLFEKYQGVSPMDYARGFLKNKRGINLSDASKKDIFHAAIMIKKRAGQLRRKEMAEQAKEGGHDK